MTVKDKERMKESSSEEDNAMVVVAVVRTKGKKRSQTFVCQLR